MFLHTCWNFRCMFPYPAVYVGSGDQNAGPYIYEARIFLIEHFSSFHLFKHVPFEDHVLGDREPHQIGYWFQMLSINTPSTWFVDDGSYSFLVIFHFVVNIHLTTM